MGPNSSDDHEQKLQVVGSADNDIDHQQQQQQYSQQQHVVINSMVIRYKCSYCGRGFSNAQALGGHMNVHRRDRAAKFINNNFVSSSSSSTSSSDHSSTHHRSQLLPWISTTKLDQEADADDIHVRQQQHHKPQHQLPLFVDTVVLPSRLISCKGHEDDDHNKEDDPKEDDHKVVIDTKREQMMHQPSNSCSHGHDDLASNDDKKLDLELRLGPHDPDDRTGTMSTTTTSTTTGTTRDFF